MYVEIDTAIILSQESDYRKVVSLCEAGNFEDAKPLLQQLISKNPTNSEYHRILGQILSEEGDQDEAINCLIDALRWDSHNGYALLMMGNILSKFKEDIPTAMKYYDQAVAANQADHIALTNIAYLFFKENQFEAAKKYALSAKKLNDNYPHTDFVLGLVAKHENELHSAFYSMTQVLKKSVMNDELTQNAIKSAFELAHEITASENGKQLYFAYRQQLEKLGGKEIDMLADESISTPAKIEFAERYQRAKHLVKFKSSYPAVAHLIMHELTHLKFMLEARNVEKNKNFISTPTNKQHYLKAIAADIQKLEAAGIPQEMQTKFIDSLFNGLNLHQYNTPIDLFIEDFLYQEFPELRPFQLLSLYQLMQEAIQGVTSKQIIALAPTIVLSTTRILSLVNARQLKELFGLNLLHSLKATSEEMALSETLFNAFSTLKNTRNAGQEYDVIESWTKILGTDTFFELEDESRSSADDIDALLKRIEQDPFGLNEPQDPKELEEMAQFQRNQAEQGTNPAILFYISEALAYFKDKSHEQIKAIAFELAQVGMTGIDPNKKDYIVGSFKGKRFTGNQLLSYLYASWALAMPENVKELQLPFKREFELANNLPKL